MTGTRADARRIAVIGSTGSIGRQTLDVVASFPNQFRVVALACRSSVDEIVAQARRFEPKLIAVVDPMAAERAAKELGSLEIEVRAGEKAVTECALHPEADVIVAAAAGVIGLLPVWEAVRAGKKIALANKEPLVVAGHLIMSEADLSGAEILPVDSEHSAVFQSLLGEDRDTVKKVTLTASGGAFRDLPREKLSEVRPEDALAHPTWEMGPKVTIDSATLMNKGLELIEARWLFDLPLAKLEVVLHRESIVHCLVEFVDGAIIAQLAQPDMRIPIQFALSYPGRLERPEAPVNLAALGALHFERFEEERWPCVGLARAAMNRGGTAPAALNTANEVAVGWFLQGVIPFTAIPEIVRWVVDEHEVTPGATIEELIDVDRRVRRLVEGNLKRWNS